MSKKELKTQEPTQAPAVQAPYTGPTGLSSNITSSDLRLPRVALLQSLSPQVQNEGDKYKPGMFIDTLTGDILPPPVVFTPVFIFKNIIKWKPRSEGGGMIWKTINPTEEQLKETQFDGDKKPTADVYINCVALVKGFETPLIVSFCKTSLKAGQDLATLATLAGCAWKFNYQLESFRTSNAKGTYFVFRVRRAGAATPEQVAEAAALYEQVKGMSIDTDYEGSTEGPHTTTDEEPKEF